MKLDPRAYHLNQEDREMMEKETVERGEHRCNEYICYDNSFKCWC